MRFVGIESECKFDSPLLTRDSDAPEGGASRDR